MYNDLEMTDGSNVVAAVTCLGWRPTKFPHSVQFYVNSGVRPAYLEDTLVLVLLQDCVHKV